MEPGRELDALVAEKVMGLAEKDWPKPCYKYHSMDGEFWCYTCAKGTSDVEPEPPRYSTDIAAAWEVVEVMSAKSFGHMSGSWDLTIKIVELSGYGGEDAAWLAFDKLLSLPSSEAAHAICLAALKVVGALP